MHVEYAKSLSPKDDSDTKTAIKLIKFQIVNIFEVQSPAKSTRNPRTAEFTLDIINTTNIIAELIKLSCLSSTEESITNAGSRNSKDEKSELGQRIDGSVITLAMNRWLVTVSNGDNF